MKATVPMILIDIYCEDGGRDGMHARWMVGEEPHEETENNFQRLYGGAVRAEQAVVGLVASAADIGLWR